MRNVEFFALYEKVVVYPPGLRGVRRNPSCCSSDRDAVVGVDDALDSIADVAGVVVGQDAPDDEVDAGELVAGGVRVADVVLVVFQAERPDVGDVVLDSPLPHEAEEGLVVPQDLAAVLAVHYALA